MRTGTLMYKVGMTSLFNEQGQRYAVTVLRLPETNVIDIKKKAVNGYDAVVIGCEPCQEKKINKPQQGIFKKLGVDPKKNIKEFRVTPEGLLIAGQLINVDFYVPNQYVDITGLSHGKGFAGVMKRWGFGGLRASHGVSVSHRSGGSTGQNQDPGKVFKGKKMAGHLGVEKVTVQHLKVLKIDQENNLLIIKGAVPGPKGALLMVRDSIKKNQDLPNIWPVDSVDQVS